MFQPIIGVTPLYDAERSSYWMLPGYFKGLQAAGCAPIMLPLTTNAQILQQLAQTCNGFLFTGGQDVDPTLYGAERKPYCGPACPERDAAEQLLLKLALQQNKPVLGICRGIQFLNAALGGTLYQDLNTEYGSAVEHHMSPPYNRAAHTVTLLPNTPLRQLLGVEVLGVNSYHHQAVKKLAPGLQAAALSQDGLTEAVFMPQQKFVWAVQWHPEFFYETDSASLKIFKALANAARP